MEPVYFDVAEGKIAIQGFPDGAKVIKLSGPLAQRLADMLLHQSDLRFADECLDGINLVPEFPSALREGLWRSALVHVMKCFGSSEARSALPEKKILKDLPPVALEVFEYFKHLRHKYIVHDENAYAQAVPGAIINDGKKDYKIEKIVCLGSLAQTLHQDNYSNLKLLIELSLKWTTEQFDLLTAKLTEELETIPYAELLSRTAPAFYAPEPHAISETRAPLR